MYLGHSKEEDFSVLNVDTGKEKDIFSCGVLFLIPGC